MKVGNQEKKSKQFVKREKEIKTKNKNKNHLCLNEERNLSK